MARSDPKLRPTLYLCGGSHCRKKLAKDGRRLEKAALRLPADVARVGCQKVCEGPVVGTTIDGEVHWFESMDTKKSLKALAELVETGRLTKPLAKRIDRRRTGKLRGRSPVRVEPEDARKSG